MNPEEEKALEKEGEDNTPAETPTAEGNDNQPIEGDDPEIPEGEPAEDKPEEKRKPRSERRIDQLTKKLAEKEATPAPTTPTTPPWEPKEDPFSALDNLSGEVSVDELKKTMAQVVDGVVTARLSQSQNQQQFQEEAKQIEKTLETDITEIQSKDERLNPKSDNYDPEFDLFITETFELAFKGNSKVRLKDIYDKTQRIVSKASDSGKSEAENSLDKQANEGALTPSMGSKAKKSYKEETKAEMEARLEKVY